jgi:hypothetical protein
VVDDGRATGDTSWVELRSPALGLRLRLPPSLPPALVHEDDQHRLFLAGGRQDWREFLALTRRPGCAGGGTAEVWHAEADHLRGAAEWTGAVTAGPYVVEIDGARGQQGWLRLRDAQGYEFIGLLWVGQVAGDRVTVAYWCGADRARCFVPRYRRILESIYWARE